MELDEILRGLCSYDERSPDYDSELTKPNDCYCDSCFYGRHKFAVALLDALKEIERLKAITV